MGGEGLKKGGNMVRTIVLGTAVMAIYLCFAPIVQADLFTDGLTDEPDALAYLEGSWVLIPQGNRERTDTSEIRVIFAEEEGEFRIAKSGDNWISAHFDLSDLFGTGAGSCNLMHIEPYDIVGDETVFDPNALLYDMDLQFLAGQIDGKDLLALREIGNGESYLGMELGRDTIGEDLFWVFRREGTAAGDGLSGDSELSSGDGLSADGLLSDDGSFAEDSLPAADQALLAEYAEMRRPNSSFYALQWRVKGMLLYLQELDGYEYLEDWFGEELPVISYHYLKNGHALTAVPYAVDENARSQASDMAEIQQEDHTYRTQMVHVTTDAEGKVTELTYLPYLNYGLYFRQNDADSDSSPDAMSFDDSMASGGNTDYMQFVKYVDETDAGDANAETYADEADEETYADETDTETYADETDVVTHADAGDSTDLLVSAAYLKDLDADTGNLEFALVSSESPVEFVVFQAQETVTEFRILSLELKGTDAEGNPQYVSEDLYTRELLTPQHPLCATITFFGDLSNNGISFVDAEGNTRYYALGISGMDGSLYLSEF